MAPIHKSGVLVKVSRYIKAHRPRYFVLENDTLRHYENENSMASVKGVHTLTRESQVSINSVSESSYGSKFMFTLSHTPSKDGDSMQLFCDDALDLERWMLVLQIAINRLNI